MTKGLTESLFAGCLNQKTILLRIKMYNAPELSGAQSASGYNMQLAPMKREPNVVMQSAHTTCGPRPHRS